MKNIVNLLFVLLAFYIIYLVFEFIFNIIHRIFRWIIPARKTPSKSPKITFHYEISSSGGYEKPRGKPAQWYGCNKKVNVQGYSIPGGLVYVGELLLDSCDYNNDACLINPKLKVSSAEPWEAGDEMGYWPHYGQIPAKCRGAYLKWLASGRLGPETYIGYVFLFFYGLERRLMIDGQKGKVSDQERLDIINEVRRLLKIYGKNRSFHGYANNLLAMEWVLYQSDKPAPDYIDFSDRYHYEPFQVVLAQYVAKCQPLPANVALQWMMLHPDFYPRTPARRCAKEFRVLFVRHYAQKFGDGLIVKPNKESLSVEYRAASPSLRLRGDLKLKVPKLPNPFFLTGPFKKLSLIAEECTEELDAYSRYLGRKNNSPNTMAAWALLPNDLMNDLPNIEQMKSCLTQICENGPGMIDVKSIYKNFREQPPNQLNKKECETLALFIESLGFGMAPDIRYHNLKADSNGFVVIFSKGHGVDFKPSKEFCTVGTILRMGAMVSQIDEDISPSEETLLQGLVRDNRELTGIEKDSLLAFLHWCLRTQQSTTGLRQRLSEISNDEKMAISHILISVAHADGHIDPREVKQLERLYTTLGLDKKQVTSDLHTLAALSEPVTVKKRDKDIGYTIPGSIPDSITAKGFHLNEELIRIREEETRQVKGVLEGIFSEQTEDEIAIAPEPITQSNTPLNALDEAHKSFFHRLIMQETWKRDTLHEICKELGLMTDGAMETLNEWAFDNANAPLIDNGEPVYVDINLAKEIINA